MNIDPLRPYLGLAKVLGWLLLASVLLFGGCSWGRAIEAEKSAGLLAKKDQALRDAAQQLGNAATALHEVNKITVQEEAAAAARQRLADFAKERALIAAEDYRRQLEKAGRDIEDAKRDRECRAQLEKPICAALR